MPHLKAFNRYLRIAGDDIAVPLVATAIGRIMWIAILIIILYLDFSEFSRCVNGTILLVFLFLTTTHVGLSLFLDCLLLGISTQGTMVQTEKRLGLSTIMKIKFFLSWCQILYGILGIIGLSYSHQIPCGAKLARSNINMFIFGIIIVSNFADSVLFLCCARLLIGYAPTDDTESELDSKSEMEKIENNFRDCLRNAEYYGCGKFTAPDETDSIEIVGKIISKYFQKQGSLDIVVSDVIAGILLVRAEQRNKRTRSWVQANEIPIPSEINWTEYDGEEIKHPANRLTIAMLPNGYLRDIEFNAFDRDLPLIVRCSAYASIIYNRIYPLRNHLWDSHCNPLQYSNCINLCCCCWFGSTVGTSKEPVFEDHHSSVQGVNYICVEHFGVSSYAETVSQSELLFISFRNDTIHKPYGIFLDHHEQLIILTIRGTLSIEDAVTDAACESIELTKSGLQWGYDGQGKWAHSGILRAATAIREELEHNQTLHNLIIGGSGHINQYNDRSVNYKLIVTGHSLGASTAVLLSILLRPTFPNLQCFAFGPGATLDYQTCQEISHFTTTIILGNDIVPRLSYRSICTFRNEILYAICRAKANKTTIMQSIFRDINVEDLMWEKGEEPKSSLLSAYRFFESAVDEQFRQPNMVDLFLPGQILHLVKTGRDRRCCKDTPHFELVKGVADDYREIVVSTSMITDHMPDYYHDEISAYLKRQQG